VVGEVEGLAISHSASEGHVLKFEVQIYKARDGEYVVDFQRLQGELFLFMDLCSKLL